MNKNSTIRPSDKYIPWLVVLFFLCFMTVDFFMVTMALRTHTGVITEDAYKKGLNYNQTINAAREQEAWGWSHDIRLENNNLTFSLKNKSLAYITDANVKVKAIREVQDGHDFEVWMRKSSQGFYEADINFPLTGEWTIRIFATSSNRTYQASKRVMAQ
jgi:nitrogen fixation protein FixH